MENLVDEKKKKDVIVKKNKILRTHAQINDTIDNGEFYVDFDSDSDSEGNNKSNTKTINL